MLMISIYGFDNGSIDFDGAKSFKSVDALFLLDKFERFKRITLPNAFTGLTNLFIPNLSSSSASSNLFGIRVCINFNANYPQGYQQNTCFLCDAYRFSSIAYQCTGQIQIPANINYTQANCIMNSCQPIYAGYVNNANSGSYMINQNLNRYQSFPANIMNGLAKLPHQQQQSKFNFLQTALLQRQIRQPQSQLSQSQEQQLSPSSSDQHFEQQIMSKPKLSQ